MTFNTMCFLFESEGIQGCFRFNSASKFPSLKGDEFGVGCFNDEMFHCTWHKENQCMNQGTDESPQLYAARVFSHKVAHPCSQQVFRGAHRCTPTVDDSEIGRFHQLIR